jgi:hypothetical protein
MPTFDPPIESRDTETLIAIAHSTPEEWQEEAIEAARRELERRGVTNEQQQEVLRRWKAEEKALEEAMEKEMAQNAGESYSFLQMIRILLLAPFYINGMLEDDESLSVLKEFNYRKKLRQRIFLLLGGMIFWVLFILAAYKYSEKQWLNKVNQTDISKWQENRVR